MNNIEQAQPPKPAQWTWIVQRGDSTSTTSASIWKLGFVAPDGAQVRVTFHQTNPTSDPTGPPPDPMAGAGAQNVVPPGQPDTAQTEDGVFYTTFFCSRNPHHFMKWDTSLTHEDSMSAWVTITHGIVDFIRKAKPKTLILDDLANGKLKMVLRSVAMDVAAANPEYDLELTQKHEYRTFYQIKKKGIDSAFGVQNPNAQDAEKLAPPPSPSTGPVMPGDTQNQPSDGVAQAQNAPQSVPPTQTDVPLDQQPQAPVVPSPVPQAPTSQQGLTVEVGKDYSIAVKDAEGNAVDRYQAKNPADILRWIKKKGYGKSKMRIVNDQQKPKIPGDSGTDQTIPAKPLIPSVKEEFAIHGKTVTGPVISAMEAATINYAVNAMAVRCTEECIEFEFATDKDMNVKRTLIAQAYADL